MVNVGTQVISRKQLASAHTPPYIKDAESLLEVALQKSASATSKEQKRNLKIPDLEKALGILEENGGASLPVEHLLALAEVHWELENSKESITFLKEAIQLAPKDARPYGLLGRYLLNKGLRDQALNFLDRAIALDSSDVQSKKLRERAARQARKSYTVVANAQDLIKGAGKSHKAVAQEKKAEATRLLDIDALRAEQALEAAQTEGGGHDQALDQALAALLGASLSNVDVSLLIPEEKRNSTVMLYFKSILVFLLVGSIAVVSGAVFQRARPQIRVDFGNEVEEAIYLATPKSLLLADAMMVQDEKLGAPAERALVYALLYSDFGHDLLHLDTAVEGLENLNEDERKTPAGFLLRVLVQQSEDAKDDPKLDAELKKELQKLEQKLKKNALFKNRSLLVMAKVERLKQKGDQALSIEILSNAALADDATPRSLLLLAKLEAANGNFALAQSYIRHGLKRFPEHAGLCTFGLLLWGMNNEAAPKDLSLAQSEKSKKLKVKNSKESSLKLEKDKKVNPDFQKMGARVEKLLESNQLSGEDAAMVGIVYGTLLLAKQEDVKAGRFLEYGRRSAKENPALLDVLSSFYLLAVFPEKAYDLLEDSENLVHSSIPLLANLTRAKLLKGLPDKSLRTLRSFSRPHLGSTGLEFPGGRFAFDPMRSPIGLRAQFDGRYFPESAIQYAVGKRGLTPSKAERRLRNVADLKLAEILLAQGASQKALAKAKAMLKRVRDNRGDNQPEYYLVLSRLYRLEGDEAAALESIESALDLESDDARVVLAAAKLQLEDNHFKAALASLKNLAASGIRSPQEFALRARALIGLSELDAAEDAIRRGSTFAKKDALLIQSYIHLNFARGLLLEARREAKKLLASKPTHCLVMAEHDVLLSSLLAANITDNEEALEKLATLSRLHEKSLPPLVLQAVLLESSSPDEAQALWAKVAAQTKGPLFELAQKRRGVESSTSSKKKKSKRKKRRLRRRR